MHVAARQLRRMGFVLLFLVACPWSLAGQTALICRDGTSLSLSTGINATGGLLSIGSKDPWWDLVAVPPTVGGTLPQQTFAVSPVTGWQAPIAGSQWISNAADNAAQPDGDYYYQSCFCLDKPAGATLGLQMRADNQEFVYLNDTLATAENSATTPAFSGTLNSFKATAPDAKVLTGPFVAGQNCVIVKVHNAGATSIGLDVAATVSAPGGVIPRGCPCAVIRPLGCSLTGTVTAGCCLGPPPGTTGGDFHAFVATVNLASSAAGCTPTVTASPGGLVTYAPTTLAAGSNTITGIYQGATPMHLTVSCGAGTLVACSVTLTTALGECAPAPQSLRR
jgi:hypothetical protein